MAYELFEQSLDNAIETLLHHCKNKQKFKKDANKVASGGIDHNDYTNKGIRRSRISGKKFIQSIFKNSAAAGSNFYDCIFDKSLFSDDFVLENNYFEHSVFYNTAFIGGEIANTTFYSCTLEGATFSDVSMENVHFTDLNIDYAVFENVKMHNVVLPF